MIDPTFTISIDRTALALSPLVIGSTSGSGNELVATNYQEPAIMHRIKYAPDSDYVHGSLALGSVLDHTLMQFDIRPDEAATEAAGRSAMAVLRTALNQFAYDVTVTVNGVAETWRCDSGSVGAAARTFANLANLNPAYPVSIPCYPVRS